MRRNFTSDQILIDRLLLDDTSAFEELTRRYCYSLYAYCMNKINSKEDAKRIVRNIFISLWENRADIPLNFSLSVYLYTEVRKAVVQCINVKLNKEIDIPAIEKQVIPSFNIAELQKAKQPIHNIQESNSASIVNKRSSDSYRNEKPRWNKYSAINLRGLKHALQNMLNLW